VISDTAAGFVVSVLEVERADVSSVWGAGGTQRRGITFLDKDEEGVVEGDIDLMPFIDVLIEVVERLGATFAQPGGVRNPIRSDTRVSSIFKEALV
jgi:hypothetical protein